MEKILEVSNLSKKYKGFSLSNINFSLTAGLSWVSQALTVQAKQLPSSL